MGRKKEKETKMFSLRMQLHIIKKIAEESKKHKVTKTKYVETAIEHFKGEK